MKQLNHLETLNQSYKNSQETLGRYECVEHIENKVILYFSEKYMEITYFNAMIVKIFIGEKNEKSVCTNAVILTPSIVNLKIEETQTSVIIKGEKIITNIDKLSSKIIFEDLQTNVIAQDFSPAFKDKDGMVHLSKVNDCYAYYGLGEKGGSLNKKGCYTENYNTDFPETDDDSLMFYKTIPFYIGVKDTHTYGIFFDNSCRSFFDMGKSYEDRIFFGACGGQIQYYFILGDTIKSVVSEYSNLTGKMELPPLWSLGYQQNRFSYCTQEEVLDVAENFEKKEIPIDVMYLDIDYMDGFRVMTFKTPHFSNAKKMIKTLHDKGIKTVAILDPGVKVDEEYGVYQRGLANNHFTTKQDGSLFVGQVWPGDSAFPDFSNERTRTWWKKELKEFIKTYELDGIWNDMNEPCVFDNDCKTLLDTCLHNGDFGMMEHKEFHNRYGLEMSRSSCEAQKELNPKARQFSMTRATYAGGQRYSSIWTGDNLSLWSQMRMSIGMNANLGMSGFSFVGNDVGGFGLDSTNELFIRWMQLGAFLPIFRNHSNAHTRRQEPWSFGSNTQEIVKKAIALRYEILPYIYHLFYESSQTGLPIFRPMVMEFQDDRNVLNMVGQFMLGESLLVAPVVQEGEREKTVYLPKGNWYLYHTNKKFSGGKTYQLSCSLEEILVFVKEGSILPTYQKAYKNTQNQPDTFVYKVYGETAKTQHYYDDGESVEHLNKAYNLCEIVYENEKVEVQYLNKGFSEKKQEFIIIK